MKLGPLEYIGAWLLMDEDKLDESTLAPPNCSYSMEWTRIPAKTIPELVFSAQAKSTNINLWERSQAVARRYSV